MEGKRLEKNFKKQPKKVEFALFKGLRSGVKTIL